MAEIKYDDYTEEEQALMKGAPYVMKPLQGQDVLSDVVNSQYAH